MVNKIGIEDNFIIIPEIIERIYGRYTATVYDGEKEFNDCGRCITPVLFEVVKENLITTVGKQLVLDRLFNLSSAIELRGTSVGTAATAAAIGDTTITNGAANYKAFASLPVRSGLTVTAITSYLTSEANIAIAEAGLLTASAGVLFNHVAPFLSFTKTSAVALDITSAITQA